MEIGAQQQPVVRMVVGHAPVRRDVGGFDNVDHGAARDHAGVTVPVSEHRPELRLALAGPDRSQHVGAGVERPQLIVGLGAGPPDGISLGRYGGRVGPPMQGGKSEDIAGIGRYERRIDGPDRELITRLDLGHPQHVRGEQVPGRDEG